MTFEIEDNIPVPRRILYPWGKLNPGQSFFVPKDSTRTVMSLVSSLNVGAWHNYGKGSYSIHTMEEGGVKGVRVYRIK
jgi:hypothetical protein